jgi:hypothetical protein
MRMTILAFATLCAFSGAAGAADAQGLRLRPAGAGDQVIAAVHAPAQPLATADLDRAPVSVAWALDRNAALQSRPQPFVRASREYWTDVSEAELRAGVKLRTTAPEALIRLSPHGGNDATLDASAMLVRAEGKQRTAIEATSQVADAAALRSAGMDVPSGTVVMKLKRDVAVGSVELAAPGAHGRYLVHVFEPQSNFVLNLGAERDSIVAGQALRFFATLDGAQKLQRLEVVEGLITAPDGHTQSLHFSKQDDGRFVASVTPDAAHAGGPGLWEVHAFASGKQLGQPVLRDAKSAFGVAAPTARFDGSIVRDGGSALALRVGVEVAAASRYQVSGVVYGTAADGSMKPLAAAQSAAWLEAGHGTIRLDVDQASLAASPLSAPFELRDLRLTNQADLSLLERRAIAFTLPR